jgi:MFS family permease
MTVGANSNLLTLPGVDVDTEKTATGEKTLSLSEEQTLQHARTFPQDKTPLYICFGQNDKETPRNFPKWKKWYISTFVAWLNFLFSFAVSFASLGFSDIAAQYNVSEVVVICAVQTVFAVGGGVGVLFWGPLSEIYGRRPTFIASQFFLVVFQAAPPVAPNIGAIFVTRFLNNLLGTAAATNTGGTIHDLWVRDESGGPLSLYTLSSVSSPPLSLVYTGYLIMNKGWQWTFWGFMAVSGAFLVLYILTIPETRPTVSKPPRDLWVHGC